MAGSGLLFVGKKRRLTCGKKRVSSGKKKEILDGELYAELWAFSNALDIAVEKTLNAKDVPITIFCDSQKALRAIEHSPYHKENRFLRSLIYEKAEKFENNGHYIAIRWIPGHSGIIGNEKADQVARNKAERGARQVERWSLLAHIRRNLTEARSQELDKWHEVKTQERDISRRGYYVPWKKGGINPTVANTPKEYASRYYQLEVGHDAVRTFLARIGLIETPECWRCGETEQSVEPLYTKCRRWRKDRRKLVREHWNGVIKLQAQAERRWLAGLPANETAVAPLLRFLKSTDHRHRRKRKGEGKRVGAGAEKLASR